MFYGWSKVKSYVIISACGGKIEDNYYKCKGKQDKNGGEMSPPADYDKLWLCCVTTTKWCIKRDTQKH